MFKYKYSTPPPTLQVLYQGVDVAELRCERGQYVFHYREAFASKGLAPLPGLPKIGEEYRSSELPRFFAERIPDMQRPEIREWMKKKGLSVDDKLALLAELSRYSVTDPFELVLNSAA